MCICAYQKFSILPLPVCAKSSIVSLKNTLISIIHRTDILHVKFSTPNVAEWYKLADNITEHTLFLISIGKGYD